MRRGRPRHPELLTPREQEVLSLIREGLTNEQIASRLGISEPGARYHVSEILSKLGVSSRVEAAAWQEGVGRQSSHSIFGLSAVRATRGLAVAAIAVPLIGLLFIAAGVGIIRLRADGKSAVREEPSGRELAGFLTLAREASRVADAQLPGASLYIVFAYPDDDTYMFRFSDPAWQNEVVVEGPRRDEPSLPTWSVTSIRSLTACSRLKR
jgi:DNA-binding CsgD family transcriptional regulator